MHATIAADERLYLGHFADRPRHTQQLDYFTYVRDMQGKELPRGHARARELGSIALAGRASTDTVVASGA
jgi:hypothetical protein